MEKSKKGKKMKKKMKWEKRKELEKIWERRQGIGVMRGIIRNKEQEKIIKK